MRKFLKFAFVGAIALTGFGFTSCSSDEDFNETTNLTGEAVKTQFTISFPENVAKTKQTTATVQEAGTINSFRGMDNIVLIPFVTEGAAGTDPIASGATPLGDPITLKNMIQPTGVDASVTNIIPAQKLLATSNAVLYNNVDIPLGTGSFLFYGKAIDNTAGTAITEAADRFKFGVLTATTTGATTDAYGFAPVAIYSETSANAVGAALASYVTAIAQAKDATDATITWATATNTALKDLYDKFITLKAGSSRHIQAAVQDLYESLYKNTDKVSVAVCTAIKTKATPASATDPTLTFDPSLGEVKANIADETTTYPLNVNIPDGAALLTWSGNTASQTITGNTANIENITGKFADYVYPASLYYVANSGVKTATTSKATQYNGTNNWDAILTAYGTEGTAVKVNTKSVAIVDPIQYAVGRLDATVKASAATLYDKKGEEVGGTNDTRFPVTGIIIGGQKAVDYMFTNPSGDDYTIYDNIVKSQSTALYATTAGTDANNYTLALETAANTKVRVAVEFINNTGKDFEGIDGVVPAGGKFYLVAELDPSADVAGKVSGSTSTGHKVFKQDFKTLANFTIKTGLAKDATGFNATTGNTEGLGLAYNTIPDLRTPKLELGLSVDLTWQSGITFTVDI
jgi:hypothetical protein